MGRKNEPGKGNVKITDNSSLRKLMRAARRGKIPPERQVIIEQSLERAAKRSKLYLSSHGRQMATLRDVLAMRR